MNVRVLLFAKARALAGRGEIEVDLADRATVGDLRKALHEGYPALQPLLPRLHVAINNDYAADVDVIPANAEVACFPPVSGG